MDITINQHKCQIVWSKTSIEWYEVWDLFDDTLIYATSNYERFLDFINQ